MASVSCSRAAGVEATLPRTVTVANVDGNPRGSFLPQEPMDATYVSPLALAVHRKHFDVVRLFLQHGKDPTIGEEFGESAYGLSIVQVLQAFECVSCSLHVKY